jgi:hypothetical protein
MATVPRPRVSACDGYLVEAPRGLVGWVEETWLGPHGEAAAFAVRTLDGQRGLMLVDDVLSILAEDERMVSRANTRLLELDAPRLDGAPPLHASWSTTGATIDAPPALGLLRRAMVARRRWLPTPPGDPHERPLWQVAALLYATIVVIAALFMLAAFVIAAAFG